MKSPCHGVEMFGGKEMVCCPRCNAWYKADAKEERKEVDQMLRMMGIDPSSIPDHLRK